MIQLASELSRSNFAEDETSLLAKEIAQGTDDQEKYEKLFWLYQEGKQHAAAMQVAQRAASLFPQRSFPQLLLAMAYRNAALITEATASLRRLLAISHSYDPWVFCFAADLFLQEGAVQQAERSLLVCLQRHPYYEDAILKLAFLWVRQNLSGPSEEILDSLNQRDPPLAIKQRTIEIFVQLRRYDKAKLLLAQLISDKNGNTVGINSDFDRLSNLIADAEREVNDFSITCNETAMRGSSGFLWPRLCNEIVQFCNHLGIERIVIWGFRDPRDHTHHWIHRGFFRACLELTRRFDNNIHVVWADIFKPYTESDKKCLFISVGLMGAVGPADEGLPIHEKSYYFIHQSSAARSRRFDKLCEAGHCLFFDEFRGSESRSGKWFEQISLRRRHIVFPWATDLLPWEIEIDEPLLLASQQERLRSSDVSFIGSIWGLNQGVTIEMIQACARRGLVFRQKGDYVDVNILRSNFLLEGLHSSYEFDARPISIRDNVNLIRRSRYAPAVQGQEHIGSYIPCRIFKNCSYGVLGMTNNITVAELLGDAVVYGTNVEDMLFNVEALSPGQILTKTALGMEIVRENHTYVNRLHIMLKTLIEARVN